MKKNDLDHLVLVYKEQLDQGKVQVAYSELIKYMQKLKVLFSKNMSPKFSFGTVFQGCMDYAYFYLSNDYLKSKKLKLGLVLNHKEMRFEIWLLGQTKDIQEKYWSLLRKTKWIKSQKIPQYSVFDIVLVENPDFGDLLSLAEEIESNFILVSNEITASLQALE